MKLTNPEKLILTMLSDIYQKIGVNSGSGIDPAFVKNAIYTDNTWGLTWEYSGLLCDSEETPAIVSEVVDLLDMWDFLEEAFEDFTSVEKKALEEKVEIFGKNVKFPGFDGNNESDYMSVARFLVNDLDRFSRFKKPRDMNSHSPSVDTYRRMYQVFEPIRTKLIGRKLDVDEMAEILMARIHPDHKKK